MIKSLYTHLQDPKRWPSKKESYMARYKEYNYSQGKYISIHFDRQILPGTFKYSPHYLIDNEIDLSLFDLRLKTTM